MFTKNFNIKHHIKVYFLFKNSKLPSLPNEVKNDFLKKDSKIISFYDSNKIIVLVSLGAKEDLEIDKLKKIVKNVKKYLKNYPKKIPIYVLEQYMINDQIQLINENYYSFNYNTKKSNKQKSNKQKSNTKKSNTKKSNTKKYNKQKSNTKPSNEYYILSKNTNINTRSQKIMADSIELLKKLGDEPSNILNPDEYVKRIEKMCKECNLKVKVFNSKKLKQMGMNSLLSVSNGSNYDGYLVEISHLPSKEKPIVLVGKGVTFDTGGISLKGSKRLYEMKGDMIGSAIVLSTMRNMALMKTKKNVIGLMAIAENMPDSSASRPGDVIKSHSGKTIEIMNTDAEGRLLLADALSYSMKFKPKLIVDLATLTGQQAKMSCGLFGTIMGFDDKTIKKIIKIGDETNDRLVEMPLYQEFINNTKSNIADVKNAEYKCGASTIHAGAFLSHFVDKKSNWIHLDVAGPTFKDKRTEGYGVKLLTKIVENVF